MDELIKNPAVCAMEKFQKEMEGEAEKAGIKSDEDIIKLIMEMRSEEMQKQTD